MRTMPEVDPKKKEILEKTLAQICKAHGPRAVTRLGEKSIEPIDVYSSGSILLDYQLGVGGLPRGRIVEIYGPESSGKTTLALHTIRSAQEAGGLALFVDAEHALDMAYANGIGVDTENLYVAQPDFGEQALQIVEEGLQAFDIIVIDSVAALTPRAEVDGDLGDAHVGIQARMMSHAMRKLTSPISKSKTLVIFLNQLRTKIGVTYGNPETTTGGNALKFAASVRLDLRRSAAIQEDGEKVAEPTKFKVVKNKVAPPFKEGQYITKYGVGISKLDELLDLGVHFNFIDKSGSWYAYQDERIGQGRSRVIEYLKQHDEIAMSVESRIREQLQKEGLGSFRASKD